MRFDIAVEGETRGIVFHKHMLLLSARHAIQYCCGGRDKGIVFHKHILLSARHAIQYCCGGRDKGHSISQTHVVTFRRGA